MSSINVRSCEALKTLNVYNNQLTELDVSHNPALNYLDCYNKLTNNKEGVAGWNGYYDAEGNLIITSKYDQERKALPVEGQ